MSGPVNLPEGTVRIEIEAAHSVIYDEHCVSVQVNGETVFDLPMIRGYMEDTTSIRENGDSTEKRILDTVRDWLTTVNDLVVDSDKIRSSVHDHEDRPESRETW